MYLQKEIQSNDCIICCFKAQIMKLMTKDTSELKQIILRYQSYGAKMENSRTSCIYQDIKDKFRNWMQRLWTM